jgi:methionyl-tRNA formyltransferase
VPKPKILFMGTPAFAVPSLEILIKKEYPVIGVVTQPDKPKGRGRQMAFSPVKIIAGENGLSVFQPVRVREASFMETLGRLRPDVIIVAAFGQILPKEILENPPLGCINVHPSLLPKYRGPAPMHWTLIRGEEKTGVTIMCINEGVDTGDMLLQEETPIETNETYDHLHDRLAKMGAELLLKTLKEIEAGNALRQPQDDALATHAPRLKKEDGLINWQEKANDIATLIRGLSSTPGAYTYMEGKTLRVFMAVAQETALTEPVGAIGPVSEQGMRVAVSDGYVHIQDVQMEGKKRMSVQDFLRGYRPQTGARLG